MSLPATNVEAQHLAKRRKIADHKAAYNQSKWRSRKKKAPLPDPSANYIFRLPVELLAESLKDVMPGDLLALSRTSKHFCNVLTSPSMAYLWKRARAAFPTSPIPDPPPNWTEPALADFIFSKFDCESCGGTIHEPPFSFSLRVKLCRKMTCAENWARKSVATLPNGSILHLSDALPHLEYSPMHRISPAHHQLIMHGRVHLKDSYTEERHTYDLMSALQDPEQKEKYFKELAARKKRVEIIMAWAHESLVWRETYCRQRERVIAQSRAHVLAYAAERGWDIARLGNSVTLVGLRHQFDRKLEVLGVTELLNHRDAIESEFRQTLNTREAINSHQHYEYVAHYVRDLHKQYMRVNGDWVTPPLGDFQRLPGVQMLHSLTTQGILDFNKSGELAKILSENLKEWERDTRGKFAALVGYEKWVSVSSKVIHPAERVTAYYECKTCNSVSSRNEIIGTLTFKEACRHVCRNLRKRQRMTAECSADVFRADEKAIRIAKDAIFLAGFDAEFATLKKLQELGNIFICKSCPSLIVMDFQSVIGHCKRHETMQVETVTLEILNSILQHDIEYGLRQRIRNCTPQQLLEYRFGCRLCGQNTKGRFAFNGLVSHMIACHKVNDVRDEDFFKVKEEAVDSSVARTAGARSKGRARVSNKA